MYLQKRQCQWFSNLFSTFLMLFHTGRWHIYYLKLCNHLVSSNFHHRILSHVQNQYKILFSAHENVQWHWCGKFPFLIKGNLNIFFFCLEDHSIKLWSVNLLELNQLVLGVNLHKNFDNWFLLRNGFSLFLSCFIFIDFSRLSFFIFIILSICWFLFIQLCTKISYPVFP